MAAHCDRDDVSSRASGECAGITRRSALGLTASLFSSALLPHYAYAATDPEARFLVVMLRGGMDGIGMLIPKLDPLYASLRRNLAIPFGSTLSLGSDFGLHPALTNVAAMFAAGDAAFAPASGVPIRNRSHFECQDNLENGLPANTPNATGWLNRLLGALPAGDPIRAKRGIQIGDAPLILRGHEPVLGWSPTWFEKVRAINLVRLRAAYQTVDPELGQMLSRGVEADRLATAAGAGGGSVSWLRQEFIGCARLMRDDVGPRVAFMSVDGWDMHSSEGALTGELNDRLSELDQALGDFKTEIGTLWAKTVVVCVTEFGRTVETNGSRGTDHGKASCSLLVGGAVKQGFAGDWPGLAPEQLEDGDLRPTVDLRGLFKGVLRDHLGVPTSVLETAVFPDSASAPPIDNLVDTPVPASARTAALAPAPAITPPAPIAAYRAKFGL